MTRAVTLIPGTTEFGYEPSTVVQSLGPGQSAPADCVNELLVLANERLDLWSIDGRIVYTYPS